jgi:UDP-glucose 4-epimerase
LTRSHLIIGGAGFIGRHVALQLSRLGDDVLLVGRHPPAGQIPEGGSGRIAFELIELGSADWDRLVAKVDVVHHYAWGSLPASANANPGGDLLGNVGPLISLLEALQRRGEGRVIFSSSGGTVYGRPQQIPVPEDHALAPINAYGAGKATAEIYLSLFRSMHGMDCRIARISNPFGAGQNISRGQGAVTTFIQHAMADERITIWGTGAVVRDYIHISDAAKCLAILANAPRHSEYIFNVGSGVGISLNEIVAELEACLGRALNVKRTEPRPIDVPVSVLSIDRAREILGWSPTLSFSEGILRTLTDLGRKAYCSG